MKRNILQGFNNVLVIYIKVILNITIFFNEFLQKREFKNKL
jgi:hypothetical protein